MASGTAADGAGAYGAGGAAWTTAAAPGSLRAHLDRGAGICGVREPRAGGAYLARARSDPGGVWAVVGARAVLRHQPHCDPRTGAAARASRTEPAMTLLDRYIASTLLSAVALVMVALLLLGMLFVFIGEQGNVGIGHYGMLDALQYSAMTLPQFALETFPAGALIGALLGIGVLARSHELTVMRASGMSKLRLSVAVVISAALLVALDLLIGEFLAQPLGQLADEQKAIAKYSNMSFAGAGAWIRDGDTILNVQDRSGAAEFGGMLIFELTPGNRLAAIARAEHATAAGPQSWQLRNYAESRFTDDTGPSIGTAQKSQI